MAKLDLKNLGSATLIIGKSGSGKSYQALSLAAGAKKGLWVVLDNRGILAANADKLKAFDIVSCTTWAEFETDVLEPIRTKAVKYDTVVVEGMDVLLSMALESIAPGQPQQQDWAAAGSKLKKTLLTIRDNVFNVIFTAAIKLTEEGIEVIALNRDSLVKLLAHFESKLYVYAEAVEAKNGAITGVTYGVQDITALTLNFIPKAKE